MKKSKILCSFVGCGKEAKCFAGGVQVCRKHAKELHDLFGDEILEWVDNNFGSKKENK